MPMNPALILFGIQAAIRLGKIGKDASEQYVRDAEALFPDIRKPQFDRRTYVNGFFGSHCSISVAPAMICELESH